MKMKRLCFGIPADTWKALEKRRVAERRHSMSDLVRAIIEAELERRQEEIRAAKLEG